MCAGCRKRRPKAELVRLALDSAGRLVVDREKILGGRGVYVCPCEECLNLAVKRKGIIRGFRGRLRQVPPGEVLRVFQEEGEWRR